MNMQAVILAAGASSKFWPLNQRHKSLLKIMGKPLVWYAIQGLSRAGIRDLIIVQGPHLDVESELRNEKFNVRIRYAVQETPKGMGNALLKAKNLLQDEFFVLNAERIDAGEYVKVLEEKQKSSESPLVLLGTQTATPWLFGIAGLEGDLVKTIVEKPEQGKEPSDIRIVGIYLLPKTFLGYLEKIPESEYSFEEALGSCMKEHDVRIVKVAEEPIALKYPWSLFSVGKLLMDTFLKPFIDESASIGKGTIIEGNVFIGKNTKVFENAVLKGPCYISDNCVIGNNSLVRDYSNLENNVVIGAFAEIARSIFQENVHTHAGYFGDSLFGKGCRIGSGFISANKRLDKTSIRSVVKGKKVSTERTNFGTIVGEDTHFGIHCGTMPGVLVGSNCVVGPGTQIFGNIDDDMSVYAKSQPIVKRRNA